MIHSLPVPRSSLLSLVAIANLTSLPMMASGAVAYSLIGSTEVMLLFYPLDLPDSPVR